MSFLTDKLITRFNARCYWCGTDVLRFGEVPANHPKLATCDHIRSKQECLTKKEYKSARNKTLACFKCNQERNNKWMARVNAGEVLPLTVVTKRKKKFVPPPKKIEHETIVNPARWYPIRVPEELDQAFADKIIG